MSTIKNKFQQGMKATKRGDTIVEVMFAFAIFSMVAVITVAMMNLGLATSERSLELVIARNEINAQAEALRFIHSSYISELTLPECTLALENAGTPCQKYQGLWQNIITAAIKNIDYDVPDTPKTCGEIYGKDGGSNYLQTNKAFIINPRQLSPNKKAAALASDAFIQYNAKDANGNNIFTEATLGARTLYSSDGYGTNTSEDKMESQKLIDYLTLFRAEGIWVVAVKGPDGSGGKPAYYDFYIRACWYGSNSPTYSSLDSVIRLYNSEGSV